MKDKKWNLDPEFGALSASVFWAVSPAPSWLCILFLLGCRNLGNEELQDGAEYKGNDQVQRGKPRNEKVPWELERSAPSGKERRSEAHGQEFRVITIPTRLPGATHARVRAPSPNRGPWLALFLSTVMWCDEFRSIWCLESRPRTYKAKSRQKLGKHNRSYSAEVST